MNIVCPSCSTSVLVDPNKLLAEGRKVVCAMCATRFHIHPESVETVSQLCDAPSEERMSCPKCGCEQQKGESCVICGISIEKYLQIRASLIKPNCAEMHKIKSDLRSTDAWYYDLFDRRLTSLLIRVLSLLLIIGLYICYSISNSRHMAKRAAVADDGSDQTTAQRNTDSDDKFKTRFDTVVSGLNANIDQCFRQCYSYLSSPWYLQGDAKPTWTRNRHILTNSMQEEYNDIITKKRSASNTYTIPTPSSRYYDCYYKVRQLSNLYDSLYKFVENYETYNYGFSASLSNLSAEHMKLQDELNSCRDSF